MTEEQIKAVVWDLGGVLVRTHDRQPRRDWERKLGLREGDLSRLVFHSEINERASKGEIPAGQLWRWVGDQFGLDEGTRNQLAIDFWSGDRLDTNLVDRIRALRPARKTALLSNAWSSLRKQLETQWQIMDAFDEVVISAEVGMVKPDHNIYKLILNRLDVRAQQSIFIDDFIENVTAAAAVGMHAIHFQNPQQAMEEFEELLSS